MGDLIVNINIYIPETLSKEERDLFEKVKDSENMKPSKATNKNNFFNRFKKIFE